MSGGDTVLDAGCRHGFFTCEIAKKGKLSVGADLELDQQLLNRHQKAVYVKCDVQCLPFVAESFDKILLSSVLQSVENDTLALKECYRVLKTDGVLVLSVAVGYCYLRALKNMKVELNGSSGVVGKLFYDFNEITGLLKSEQFEVLETEFSPKNFGSLLYELELYLCLRFKTALFSSLLFPFFHLLSYFDRLAASTQVGDDVVVLARKVTC